MRRRRSVDNSAESMSGLRLAPRRVSSPVFRCVVMAGGVVCCAERQFAKEYKGGRWMPWLTEAMKDVISCDKPGVGANNL